MPLLRGSWTVRSRIAAAILVGGTLAATLGLVAADSLGQGDAPLRNAAEARLAIDASRTAAVSFARMRVADARLASPESFGSGARTEGLDEALHRQLRLAAGHTQSVRSSQAALDAKESAQAWRDAARRRIEGATPPTSVDLDRLAMIADAQIERLIGGLETEERESRRQDREAGEMRTGLRAAAAACCLLAIAAALGWLVRSASTSGAAALRLAERIESGEADADLPLPGGRYGTLLHRMAALRGALDETRAREAVHARSWEALLPAALAAARDGIVLTDAAGRVAFANAQAASLLGSEVGPGMPGSALRAALGIADEIEAAIEIRLPDGRRLRASRSRADDGSGLVILSEITAAAENARRLAARNRHLDEALDTMGQGLCLYDTQGRLTVVNRRYHEIYRLPPDAVRCGMVAEQVLAACAAAGNHPSITVPELIDETVGLAGSYGHEPFFQQLGDGRIVAICQQPTGDGGLLATYEDVTERWHAESRIAHMARHDMLTDLPNRILLRERIDGALTQAGPDRGFAVLYLDLDHFKRVNDTLGHAVGDELLRAVGHRLRACVRESDTVGRLGGDEFAILRADVTGPEDVTALAQRVIQVLSAPYELSEHSVTVGVSIGVSAAPADGMSAERLLKNADVALYRAKVDGRGGLCFFEAEMDARLQARRLLEIDLRAAVASEAFELYYQPIYDLVQDRICGFEALLRWTHPVRGRVSPAEFVPLAEEIGLIVPLGEWVLRQACQEASRWPGDLKIAVNVSPVQFTSAGLLGAVRDALGRSGLAPRRLELEITENVVLNDGGSTLALLHALKSLGLRVSMDDFGTGYSSLSYLRSFPFDKIKIDQSFIRDLTEEDGSGFIVRAVISLSGSMGMITTAEGVETEAQLARLREEGCDEVQGYLFSPPVPAVQVGGLLDRWNGPVRAVA